jgi:hypothetical protein
VEDLADAKDLVRRFPLAGLCLDTAHSGIFDDLATFCGSWAPPLTMSICATSADRRPRYSRTTFRPGGISGCCCAWAPDLVPPGDGLLDLALGLEGLAWNQEWWVVEMEPFDGLEARHSALARAHRVGHSLLDATTPR